MEPYCVCCDKVIVINRGRCMACYSDKEESEECTQCTLYYKRSHEYGCMECGKFYNKSKEYTCLCCNKKTIDITYYITYIPLIKIFDYRATVCFDCKILYPDYDFEIDTESFNNYKIIY